VRNFVTHLLDNVENSLHGRFRRVGGLAHLELLETKRQFADS
jgi:hypothetical protein